MNYAGFWRRAGACFIDGLILAIPGLAVGGAVQQFWVVPGMNLLLGLLYYPVFECSELSATPGKALLGVAVLTENEERIDFKAAILRYFCRYFSMIILYMGYVMQLFTPKRQTLHDMISKTIVVNKESADLNYFSVWNRQFQEIINKL